MKKEQICTAARVLENAAGLQENLRNLRSPGAKAYTQLARKGHVNKKANSHPATVTTLLSRNVRDKTFCRGFALSSTFLHGISFVPQMFAKDFLHTPV